MGVDRITAALFFGLGCCATLTNAGQDGGGPTPAVERLAPMPADMKLNFNIAAGFARRPLRKLPDDGSDRRYRGTSIKSNARARGDVLLIQQRIATKLSQLDFQPPERIQHFQWMKGHPVTLLAWHGEIQSTALTPDGALARVKVWPNVAPIGGFNAVHSDFFYEDYIMGADGSIEYVGFDAPVTRQGFGGGVGL